jgi:hypothetical protein
VFGYLILDWIVLLGCASTILKELEFRQKLKVVPLLDDIAGHFDHVLKPFADGHNMNVAEFACEYQKGTIIEPLLDEYFVHDRAGDLP